MSDGEGQILQPVCKGQTNPGPSSISDRKPILVQQSSVVNFRSSPLPDPAELAQYSALIPDGANRIMKMAENQSAHRIAIEKVVIESQQNQAVRGQYFGLIISLAGLALATYAANNGHDVFGGVIGGTTLIGLVSAFLVSKKQIRQELEQKRPSIPQTNQNSQSGRNGKKNRKR